MFLSLLLDIPRDGTRGEADWWKFSLIAAGPMGNLDGYRIMNWNLEMNWK